ncbi:MAG: DMT family transporter [Hyphomicrobiaceae bacterium]
MTRTKIRVPSPSARPFVLSAVDRRPAGPATTGTGRPLVGIALMIGCMSYFPLMDAVSKLLQDRLHVSEVVFGRTLIYFAMLLPFLIGKHGFAWLTPAHPWLQVLRGTLATGSTVFFTLAIATLPLADSLAIFFIHPMLATALSPLLLGERVGPWRWSAVFVGFIGALIIIRPGFAEISPAMLLAIAAGFCFATSMLLTRRLAASDPALTTLSISTLISMAVTGGMLPFVWLTPTLSELLLIAVAGFIGFAGYWMLTLAYSYAAASQLAPFTYVEIVGATVLGYLMFGDFPAPIVWAGVSLIVGSGIVIAWRESRAGRQ